jgi:alkanesulfonate monooxygenase SsuD/methylene tetrahydromethanopterin reductase-like flavin-dependent oxidoreductase (luciferase family)
MLIPGRATYEGEHASVTGAINEPKGLQTPRVPIIVGGNGKNVTMRLAARFADELNLVFRPVDELRDLIAVARQRCEEIDRDPASLRLSLYVADPEVREPGQRRVDLLGALTDIGLDRLVAFPTRYGADPETQAAFADDCRAAGLLGEAAVAVAAGPARA